MRAAYAPTTMFIGKKRTHSFCPHQEEADDVPWESILPCIVGLQLYTSQLLEHCMKLVKQSTYSVLLQMSVLR